MKLYLAIGACVCAAYVGHVSNFSDLTQNGGLLAANIEALSMYTDENGHRIPDESDRDLWCVQCRVTACSLFFDGGTPVPFDGYIFSDLAGDYK